MSNISDDAAAILVPDAFEHLGESATYTAAGGSPVDLQYIPDGLVDSDHQLVSTGVVAGISRAVKITNDAAGDYGGVAAPAVGDAITIGSTVYGVVQVFEDEVAGLFRLLLDSQRVDRYGTDQQWQPRR
jgi:hypothetical protein